MDCFGICSACFLVASFAMVGGQGVSRDRTSSFGRWTKPLTLSTVHMTKSHTVPTSTPVSSVCDEKCCKCDSSKTRVECTSSHHCNEFTLNTNIRLPKEARIVIFTGYLRLKINKDSLNYSPNLQKVTIERVDEIEAESYALSQPACNDYLGLRSSSRPSLVINGSGSINFMRRTLTGAWGEILIINSKMKVMESETFYNTSCLKKFTLERNFIKEIKIQTLADGQTQYLFIKSNEIQSIEHGAFQLNVTDSANISSNRINVIQSDAFVLRTPRTFSFLNNTVGSVFPYAFQLAASESIDIKFSAFDKIARHAFREIKTVGNAKMTIILSLKKFDKGALDLNQLLFSSSLQFVEIQLDRDCDCELQVLVDTVFSSTLITNASSKDDINSVLRDLIFCRVHNMTKKFHEFASSRRCQTSNVLMLVSITCAILGILLLFTVIVKTIFRQKAKLRRTSVETSNGWVMHIYTETECQVKEEFTVPLESVSENGPENGSLFTAYPNGVCQGSYGSGLPTYHAACSLSKESAKSVPIVSDNFVS